MKKPFLIIVGSALVTGALIKAAPALADPAPPQNVAIVHAGDLDLSTQAGRAQLNHRLVIAADEVCGAAADIDLVGKNAVRQCRSDVLANARSQIGQLASLARRTILIAANR